MDFSWFMDGLKIGVSIFSLVGIAVAFCIVLKRTKRNQEDTIEKTKEMINNALNKASENTEEEEEEEYDEIDDVEDDDDEDDDEDTYMLLPLFKDSGIYLLSGDVSFFYAEGDNYIDNTEGATVEIVYNSLVPYLLVDNSCDPSKYTFYLMVPEQVIDLSV